VNYVDKLRRRLVLSGVLASWVVLAYVFLLDDRAKESLRTSTKVVKDSYLAVREKVNDSLGLYVEEDEEHLQNRIDTLEQWKILGY
jgi:hypothetical protein